MSRINHESLRNALAQRLPQAAQKGSFRTSFLFVSISIPCRLRHGLERPILGQFAPFAFQLFQTPFQQPPGHLGDGQVVGLGELLYAVMQRPGYAPVCYLTGLGIVPLPLFPASIASRFLLALPYA
jgi:hypothetical protein